jgi:predicted nuclease of restriction endonuclease-like RecB superfamily
MLPTELLAVQRWGDMIKPRYVRFTPLDLSAAEAVISAYAGSIGLKRWEIREKVRDLEDAYGDYRLVRGLAALVERSCTFTSKASVNPLEVRHSLFAEAARRGFPTSPEAREEIIRGVASALGLQPQQVEESMYADLDSEEALESCPSISPIDLLKQYNLSLTQTLLFNSTEMEFTASGNWQRIFRAIKYYGLMYMAYRRSGVTYVKLNGSISIFKLTRRYGTALAKVIPEVVRGSPWRMEAKILRSNRLLTFRIDSQRHGWLFPELQAAEEYDSAVEEEFAEQFRRMGEAWALRREPEPIEAGSTIMIPDFSFTFGGKTVYMEIVGFWTREYLRRKIEKLSEVRAPIIVAVDEELACDRIERLKASNPNIHLIYYKGRIPVREVLAYLQPLASAAAEAQASTLELAIGKPVASLREVAEAHGVTEEAVRRAAGRLKTHILVGEVFIERRLLEEAGRALARAVGDGIPLSKAIEVLKPYGVPNPIAVIAALGYKIRWVGLDNATVAPSTPPT